MSPTGRRPFYSEYAWAVNLIIDRPVRKECAVSRLPGWWSAASCLVRKSWTPAAAPDVTRLSWLVAATGWLASTSRRNSSNRQTGSCGIAWLSVVSVGDILDLANERYQAILCRGVLNDILDDGERDAVFASFAKALRPGGVLIVDVRDWGASVERKSREPLFRKRVSTDRGELTFTAVTALDQGRRQLPIFESHALVSDGQARVSDYEFVMRCWERRNSR